MGAAVRIVLCIVDAFVALTAIGGGIALVAGLERSRFPDEMLERTPFRTYTVPALLLVVVVGGSAAIAAAAVALGRSAGGTTSVVAGALLIGWIVGEVTIFEYPHRPAAIEWFYLAIGLAMAVLGIVVWVSER